VTLDDLVTEMERVMAAREPAFRETVEYIRSISAAGSKEGIEKTAGLKLAMRSLAEARGCRAVAIQCWDSLQHLTGVMPCLSNALLSDEGLPVVCETDIHGAITAVMTTPAVASTIPGPITGRISENLVSIPPVKRMIQRAIIPTNWVASTEWNEMKLMPNSIPTPRKKSKAGAPKR